MSVGQQAATKPIACQEEKEIHQGSSQEEQRKWKYHNVKCHAYQNTVQGESQAKKQGFFGRKHLDVFLIGSLWRKIDSKNNIKLFDFTTPVSGKAGVFVCQAANQTLQQLFTD